MFHTWSIKILSGQNTYNNSFTFWSNNERPISIELKLKLLNGKEQEVYTMTRHQQVLEAYCQLTIHLRAQKPCLPFEDLSNSIVLSSKTFDIKCGAIEDVENGISQLCLALCFAYSMVFLNLDPIFLQYNLESYRLELFSLVQQFKRLLPCHRLFVFCQKLLLVALYHASNGRPLCQNALHHLCSQPHITVLAAAAPAILLSAGPKGKTWLLFSLCHLKRWSHP